jgi:hypothetical protein
MTAQPLRNIFLLKHLDSYFGIEIERLKLGWRAPDKGEVGGSSPPRPTIQITSKYAAILTFPLFGDLPQKTVLSTVCQL